MKKEREKTKLKLPGGKRKDKVILKCSMIKKILFKVYVEEM